jgi:tetratricopeptide (TPR) repeat protein
MLLLATALASLGSAARADTATAQQHFAKGRTAFDLGNYDEAVQEYASAYRLKDDPALLYDIAQAHRLAQHYDEALRFYKIYLVREPNARNRAEVEARIAELQPLAGKGAGSARAVTPAATASPTDVAVASTPPPSPPSQRGLRIAGVTVAAIGAGALVGGAVAAALARAASDNLSAAGRYDPEIDQAGARDQAVAAALLAVGGAALVTGAVLYAVGHARDRRWSFAAARAGTGASLAWTF